jgi:hypothetical protein
MAQTYSFQDVSASLTGPSGQINLGYGASIDKEGITLARNADRNKMAIGADGNGQHSLSADRSGTITVRLFKVSPTNAALMAMVDAQQLNSALWGQNTIVVRQNVSGDISTSTQCAFKKIPDMKYAEEGGMVEWTWDVINMGTILGVY